MPPPISLQKFFHFQNTTKVFSFQNTIFKEKYFLSFFHSFLIKYYISTRITTFRSLTVPILLLFVLKISLNSFLAPPLKTYYYYLHLDKIQLLRYSHPPAAIKKNKLLDAVHVFSEAIFPFFCGKT